jgi:hypothetical protein
VYVDSGSVDGSLELARAEGVSVVALDPSSPFTAARARNAGFERAVSLHPGLEFVQFVDGDCELMPGWLERGVRELQEAHKVAAVAGRIRELNRGSTIYNRLCDLEWDVPAGEAASCGGLAMMRVEAFRASGGFDPSFIAGEEPELCVRLRRNGWSIRRVAADMAVHDADMTHFGQWWRRSVRAGWAYAEGASVHGASAERHWLRENASIAFWGALVPLAAVGAAIPTGGVSLLLLAGHAVLAARVYIRAARAGVAPRDARLQAAFTVVGKLPQAIGQAHFVMLRGLGRRRRVVDWRSAT